ncbi:hypothetical protein [Kutzneria sp. CA-103260]|uniref:hypothetical protein n=1 Tax=Kutzneria sp. CA-103260 TaxID=2802641 RepID=UPI001BA6CA41|nr:hypothetical protein [Kutzneria sp. CA-103260]QUQ70670.1 hypothetical protein JJ691_84530 [Kutzneria sp. CA-103260]
MRTRSLFCVSTLAAALLAIPATALATPAAGCSNRDMAWIHLFAQENLGNELDSNALCPGSSHWDLKNSKAHDHVRSWEVSGPIPQNGGKHMTVCLLDYVGSQRVVLGRLSTGGWANAAQQGNLGNNNDRADAVELC